MKAPKHWYMQFDVGAWMKDPAVSSLTSSARGVWFDLLCAMHEAGRSGELRKTRPQLAILARCSAAELDHALTELQATEAAEICDRNGIVTVRNRKMFREAQEREAARVRQQRSRANKTRCADVTPPLEKESESELLGHNNPSAERASRPSRTRGSGVFVDISPEVLRDQRLLQQWFDQERRRPDAWVSSEADWVNVRAAAAKALSAEDVADPVGLFKWLVKNRMWGNLSDANDDLAAAWRRELKELAGAIGRQPGEREGER